MAIISFFKSLVTSVAGVVMAEEVCAQDCHNELLDDLDDLFFVEED